MTEPNEQSGPEREATDGRFFAGKGGLQPERAGFVEPELTLGLFKLLHFGMIRYRGECGVSRRIPVRTPPGQRAPGDVVSVVAKNIGDCPLMIRISGPGNVEHARVELAKGASAFLSTVLNARRVTIGCTEEPGEHLCEFEYNVVPGLWLQLHHVTRTIPWPFGPTLPKFVVGNCGEMFEYPVPKDSNVFLGVENQSDTCSLHAQLWGRGELESLASVNLANGGVGIIQAAGVYSVFVDCHDEGHPLPLCEYNIFYTVT